MANACTGSRLQVPATVKKGGIPNRRSPVSRRLSQDQGEVIRASNLDTGLRWMSGACGPTSSSSSPTTSATPISAATAAARRARPSSIAWPREGLRFTDGYANSPVCSPTRFALMTGRYQYRLRGGATSRSRAAHRGNAVLGLPPEHPTLPSLLRDAGYATALVGKWHLGFRRTSGR